jgi:acetyl esterase
VIENVQRAASVRHRALDPELAALQVLIPEIDITEPDRARAIERHISAELGQGPGASSVEVQDIACVRPDGSEYGLRLYRPLQTTRRSLPGLLFLHGGSFVMGNLDTENARCENYALGADCLVIAVDYRLAPEHPFPAGFEDACLALRWIDLHADELGIDREYLAVGGLSAGAAIAAGVAAEARDNKGPGIALQLLLFPALDASMTTLSVQQFADTPILNSGGVATMWELYLGGRSGSGHASASGYASPAQLDDLALLPPTFLCTAEFDPLRDEGLAFAQRLLHADVPVELRLYARAFHSFDSFRATRLATLARRDQVDALRVAFIRSGR